MDAGGKVVIGRNRSGTLRSRRQVSVDDASSWVFNRIADVYDARPPYPVDLIEALAQLASTAGLRIADVGAGIGDLTLPLAERGFELTAVEPAYAMLQRLRTRATDCRLGIRMVHAAAERLPLDTASADLVLLADALHFVDTELAAREIARVLVPGGLLALVTTEFTPTPFMQEVVRLMEASAPRRPRSLAARRAQLAGIARVSLGLPLTFQDETPVSRVTLERILASISFIGPAMNAERTTAFRERLHLLRSPAIWARTFTLHFGRRSRSSLR